MVSSIIASSLVFSSITSTGIAGAIALSATAPEGAEANTPRGVDLGSRRRVIARERASARAVRFDVASRERLQ
jgi:hypothetical protein